MRKRVFSILLAICLLLSLCPTAYAAEDSAVTADSSASITGSNSLGKVLAAGINEADNTAGEGYESGCYIKDVSVEGSTAKVHFAAQTDAQLVVALYSEDRQQLLTSASATVAAGETEQTVTFVGELPAYFYVSVYLLDGEDLSPLCDAYNTPMYTQQMQELLASTVHSYGAERVLNLDDSETTNFAVFAEGVIRITEQEAVNRVVSVDEENAVYIIEYADESITSLQANDVIAYAYGDNQMFIAKVASVSVNGTTVTISGGAMEIRDVFEVVKIEAVGKGDEAVVDTTSADEGVTYLPAGSGEVDNAAEGTNSNTAEMSYEIAKEWNSGQVKLSGSLKLELGTEFYYYMSMDYQRVEFEISKTATAEVKLSAKLSKVSIPLGKITIPTGVVGLTVEVAPDFVVEATASLSSSISFKTTDGFIMDHENGEWCWQKINETSDPKGEIKLSGSLFVGLKMDVAVEVIDGYGASCKLGVDIGVKFSGKENPYSEDGDVRHLCVNCIDGDTHLQISIDTEVSFLKQKTLTEKVTLLEWSHKIGDFYYCPYHDQFGAGSCPNVNYALIVTVADETDAPISDVAVKIGSVSLQTDETGIAETYLPNAKYTVQVRHNGILAQRKLVLNNARKVHFVLKENGEISSTVYGVFGTVSEETIIDRIIASGTCGKNVSWTLSNIGLLHIYGSGNMNDFNTGTISSYQPWRNYNNDILSIVIDEGVSNIGANAFYGLSGVTEVTIPASVTKINDSAFKYCYSLHTLDISAESMVIGYNAFDGCSALTTVDLPVGVTTISEYAFANCDGLVSVTIPEGVTTIGDHGFDHCDNLAVVSLPNGLKSIGAHAFRVCSNLTTINLPDGITEIGEGAFQTCSSLTEVVLPDSITTISTETFYLCSGLTSVHIPDSVTAIGEAAFRGCSSLQTVSVPDSVTLIRAGAFADCSELISVELPNSIHSMAEQLFLNCVKLESITIPDSVTRFSDYVFDGCDSLKEIVIPASVVQMGASLVPNIQDSVIVWFEGSAPTMNGTFLDAWNDFGDTVYTIYYPAEDTSWTEDLMMDHSDGDTWIPYTRDEGGNVVTGEPITFDASAAQSASVVREVTAESLAEEVNDLGKIYGGTYGAIVSGAVKMKTADFNGLQPGAGYVMLALKSISQEDILAADNVLAVQQAVSKDGTLSFRYIQREDTAVSYVFVCGPAGKNISDGEITFPTMTAGEELRFVDPVVVYKGTQLTEGIDYELAGDVRYMAAGDYICEIHGIGEYYGAVYYTYTVLAAGAPTPVVPTPTPETPVVTPTPTPVVTSTPTPDVPVGTPTPEPTETTTNRVAGAGRCETAIAAAGELKTQLGVEQFNSIIIASGSNFADALAGSYLATVKSAPILLYRGDSSIALNRNYILANLTYGGTVYLLGGSAAVPAAVEDDLNAYGISVKRLAGPNRFDTNIQILLEAGVTPGDEILVATGYNFADSLSASATGKPMLLVNSKSGKLTDTQIAYLQQYGGGQLTILGGTGAVSAGLEYQLKAYGDVARIAGASRYDTSVKIAEKYFKNVDTVVVAYGKNFPDGLAGGPVAYAMNAPLILTQAGSESVAAKYVADNGVTKGYILGGEAAVTESTVEAIFGK